MYVTQAWYTDDVSAGGRTSDLCVWWDSLVSRGPHFGYNPTQCKTWLVVKPEHLARSRRALQGLCGVNITIQGHRHLGAPLGSKSFVEELIWEKISCWVSEIKRLFKITKFQPQTAYAVFTHALTSRWAFLMLHRPSPATTRGSIRHQFLPCHPSDTMLSEISQHNFSWRYARTCVLNQLSSCWFEKVSPTEAPILRKVQDLMSRPKIFGTNANGQPSLTSESSILTHHRIVQRLLQKTRTRKEESLRTAYPWGGAWYHYSPWCCPQEEAGVASILGSTPAFCHIRCKQWGESLEDLITCTMACFVWFYAWLW